MMRAEYPEEEKQPAVSETKQEERARTAPQVAREEARRRTSSQKRRKRRKRSRVRRPEKRCKNTDVTSLVESGLQSGGRPLDPENVPSWNRASERLRPGSHSHRCQEASMSRYAVAARPTSATTLPFGSGALRIRAAATANACLLMD